MWIALVKIRAFVAHPGAVVILFGELLVIVAPRYVVETLIKSVATPDVKKSVFFEMIWRQLEVLGRNEVPKSLDSQCDRLMSRQ